MKALSSLLLVSMLTVYGAALANTQTDSSADRVSEAIMLMLKGEKQNAWNLFLTEARQGNATAMFHMGNMMLQSPEHDDYLERAKSLFTAAAARGHQGAEAMKKQVGAAIDAASSSSPPTIAGVSGLPTPEQVEDARRRLGEYTAQAIRYTGFVTESVPKVKITAFAENNAESISRLSSMVSAASDRFKEAIGVDFYIVVDPDSWNSSQTQIIRASEMPREGFMPDFGGRIAQGMGVRSAPAIVIQPENGRARVIRDPNSLISEISSLL